jgi:hypothetical protein
MKNGSYFVEREKLHGFMKGAAMNEEEGLYIYWETDPEVARRVLPPQFKLADPEHPHVYSYFVNIREPTFAPWYMEAGIGILGAQYKEQSGLYFCNLQLSGAGVSSRQKSRLEAITSRGWQRDSLTSYLVRAQTVTVFYSNMTLVQIQTAVLPCRKPFSSDMIALRTTGVGRLPV